MENWQQGFHCGVHYSRWARWAHLAVWKIACQVLVLEPDRLDRSSVSMTYQPRHIGRTSQLLCALVFPLVEVQGKTT